MSIELSSNLAQSIGRLMLASGWYDGPHSGKSVSAAKPGVRPAIRKALEGVHTDVDAIGAHVIAERTGFTPYRIQTNITGMAGVVRVGERGSFRYYITDGYLVEC